MIFIKKVPEKGFYYHYKHDSKGLINNYAYEVLGLCKNTEKTDEDDDRYMVLYRPLYQNTYLKPADYSIRPLCMFIENVMQNGVSIPRFRKINNPVIIGKIEREKTKIYGCN